MGAHGGPAGAARALIANRWKFGPDPSGPFLTAARPPTPTGQTHLSLAWQWMGNKPVPSGLCGESSPTSSDRLARAEAWRRTPSLPSPLQPCRCKVKTFFCGVGYGTHHPQRKWELIVKILVLECGENEDDDVGF